MGGNRELVTTSVSIPNELLEKGRVHAAASYRTFSQYVSYLIDQDLTRFGAEEPRRAERQSLSEPAVCRTEFEMKKERS